MNISDETLKFLKGSSLLDKESTIYICSNDSCFLKCLNGDTEKINKKISSSLSNTLKLVNEYLVINNSELSIFDNSESKNYMGIVIFKLQDDNYLLFTRLKNFFDKKDVEYGKTTVNFLNKLLQ